MINILTLKFGDKYGPEYVNRLYASLKRNTTVDFNFYCYTSDPEGLRKEIKTIDLDPSVNTHWQKLEFHKKGFMPEGSKCLILDLDWVILKNIDDLLSVRITSDLVGFNRWWTKDHKRVWVFQGGFQMFINGKTDYLWQEYKKHDINDLLMNYHEKHEIDWGLGEQFFITEYIKTSQALPSYLFVRYSDDNSVMDMVKDQWKYKVSVEPLFQNGKLNKHIRMVHFSSNHFSNKLDNDIETSEWAKRYWYD